MTTASRLWWSGVDATEADVDRLWQVFFLRRLDLESTFRLIVKSGRLDVDATYRVHEISIDLDGQGAKGGETVTLASARPRPDYRRRTRLVDRRLKNLERR